MKKLTLTARLATDIICAVFLVSTYLTGHADSHVHALLGMLLIVAVAVRAEQAHKKIAGTTRNLANSCMNAQTKLDCCMGLAIMLFLVAALVSGVFLMQMRVAQGMSFDEVAGTAAGIVHMCSAVLFLICAIVHLMPNKERLKKLLKKEKAA